MLFSNLFEMILDYEEILAQVKQDLRVFALEELFREIDKISRDQSLSKLDVRQSMRYHIDPALPAVEPDPLPAAGHRAAHPQVRPGPGRETLALRFRSILNLIIKIKRNVFSPKCIFNIALLPCCSSWALLWASPA